MLSNKIAQIMARQVLTSAATQPILAVMKLMAERNVGVVLVMEAGAPAGILSEQDVLRRVMGKRIDPAEAPVKKVMTTGIQTVNRDAHIVEALGKMYQKKVRHLLVEGPKGEVAGMVSMRDILRLAVELGQGLTETRTVGSVMSRSVVKVAASQPIAEVLEVMVKKKLGCVIVRAAGQPPGIFTERDVLKRVAIRYPDVDVRKTAVREVMTRKLVTVPESALVGEVLGEMHSRGIRNMPVSGEKGDLVGIVSMAEVLRYARALDVDEGVRRAWREVQQFWESEEQYTPG
jgi:CBS domain-containing protein